MNDCLASFEKMDESELNRMIYVYIEELERNRVVGFLNEKLCNLFVSQYENAKIIKKEELHLFTTESEQKEGKIDFYDETGYFFQYCNVDAWREIKDGGEFRYYGHSNIDEETGLVEQYNNETAGIGKTYQVKKVNKSTERVAKHENEHRKAGRVQRKRWAHPEDWEAIDYFIMLMNEKRNSKE